MQKARFIYRPNVFFKSAIARLFIEVQEARAWENIDNGQETSIFEVMPCGCFMVETLRENGRNIGTSVWSAVQMVGGARDGEIEAFFDEQNFDDFDIEIMNYGGKNLKATSQRLKELCA